MVVMRLVLLIAACAIIAVSSNAAAGDVWPTLHNDYQRSGYTDEVLKGPFERKWFCDFHGEMIASRVEAILAEGMCFVPTFAGNLYALDIADGRTLWKYAADGQIGHSPCYHEASCTLELTKALMSGAYIA